MSGSKKLGLLDTTLYAVVGMLGVRWLPVAAAAGPGSLPLWLVSFIVFYLPLALVVAEMTSRFSGDGSIYEWVRDTFGPLAGFICGWFYWLALFAFFANTVYFIAGLILNLSGAPQSPGLFLALSIGIILLVTAVQLFGVTVGKWLTNAGAIGGWSVVLLFFVVALFLACRGQSATHFGRQSWWPAMNFNSAILWSTMSFAMGGAEMLGFLRSEIRGGMRTVRKALLFVGILLVIAYTLGTAAMLTILPEAALTRLSGLPDAIQASLLKIGASGMGPIAVALYATSSLGGLIAWFGVGTRLPMEAGIDSFLPPVFARTHPRTGAPIAAILLQSGLTLFCIVLGQAGATAAVAYDLLVQLAVLTNAIPYAMVFAAYAARSRWDNRPGEEIWLPPGGPLTGRILGWTGLIATIFAIICTLVPDAHDAHPLATFLKISLSALCAGVLGLVLFVWRRPRSTPAAA